MFLVKETKSNKYLRFTMNQGVRGTEFYDDWKKGTPIHEEEFTPVLFDAHNCDWFYHTSTLVNMDSLC